MTGLPSYLRDSFSPHPFGGPSAVDEARSRVGLMLAESVRRLEEESAYGGWEGPVSPLDRYLDGTTVLRPTLPFGGRQARRGGREQPTFTTEPELLAYRELSRAVYRWNDFAGGLIDRKVEYVCQKGYGWTATRGGAKKSADADQHAPPEVLDCQGAFDDFRDRQKWRSRQKEYVLRGERDGEGFVRLFRGKPKCPPTARWVEPEYVLAPVGGLDADSPLSFGVLTRPGDVEGVLGYFVTDPKNPSAGEAVRAAGADEAEFLGLCETHRLPVGAGVMLHFKRNVDGTVKRGLPTLLASTDGLELARKLVRDVTSTADFQAKIGLIRQHDGATLAGLVDYQSAFTGGATVRVPGVSGGVAGVGPAYRDVPAYIDPAGTKVIDSTDRTNYLPGPVSAGVANFLEANQAQLRAAGARSGMPEYMISGDASNANFSSTKEAGSPFVTATESRQLDVSDFERDVAREVIRLSCESGAVAADPDDLDVEIVVPPVAMKSDLEQAQVEDIRVHNGTLSPQEAIRHRGADPKHVAADLAAWRKLNPAPAPGGGTTDPGEEGQYGTDALGRRYKLHRGGPGPGPDVPPTAAEGRVRETTDASGHKHKGKGPGGGQFTAGDGGGGKAGGKPNSRPPNKSPAKSAAGKPAGKVKEKTPSAKARRAKAAHVLVDAGVQRYAEEHNEPRFAKAMKGVSFPNSEAVDVAIPGRDGKVAHGVELKTMTAGKDDKITMNAYAQVRKKLWEQGQGATFHTVVSDDRLVKDANGPGQHDDSKRVYYYRRGIAGSARIGSMHRVTSEAELKKLMAMPEHQLPPAARRTEKEWLTAGKWEPLPDGERGYRNTATGQEVRPKK